jgi:hypothetical protein
MMVRRFFMTMVSWRSAFETLTALNGLRKGFVINVCVADNVLIYGGYKNL